MKKSKIIIGLFLLIIVSFSIIALTSKNTSQENKQSANIDKSNNARGIEITVDGVTSFISQDDQTNDQMLLGTVLKNQGVSITASDKKSDYAFALYFDAPELKIGSYKVYQCFGDSLCEDAHRNQKSSIQPYLTEKVDMNTYKASYDYPSLSLSPMVVTIASIEDAVWEGIGQTKLITGTFKGTLASVQKNSKNEDYVAGKTTTLEGKFKIYTLTR